MKKRRSVTLLLVLVGASVLGCDGGDGDSGVTHIVETRVGATCGFFAATDGPDPVNHFDIKCAAGLSCSQALTVEDGRGAYDSYGQCMPEGELQCPCPAEFYCDALEYNRCEPTCSVDQDCPNRRQTCDGHSCGFQICVTEGATPCAEGRHCDVGLCVQDGSDG